MALAHTVAAVHAATVVLLLVGAPLALRRPRVGGMRLCNCRSRGERVRPPLGG